MRKQDKSKIIPKKCAIDFYNGTEDRPVIALAGFPGKSRIQF